jgi:peptidylprolyl isomerase
MCSADGDQPQLSRRQFALSLAAIALVGRAGSDSGTARAADAAPDKGYLTPSGLRYFDFVVGDGVKPQWGDYLQLNFAMYTISPKGDALVPVYSTFPNKKLKFRVHHGNGQLILGLEEALHSMHVGGRRRIIVPPNLSYVIPGLGPIPPSTRRRKKFFEDLKETEGTVVFDVEIVSREPNGDDPYHYYEDKTPSPEELSTMLQRIQKENIAKGLPQFQWDETKYFPE